MRRALIALLVWLAAGTAYAAQWNALPVHGATPQSWDRRVCWIHSATAMSCINQNGSTLTAAVERYWLDDNKVFLETITPRDTFGFRRVTGVGGDADDFLLGGSKGSGHWVYWGSIGTHTSGGLGITTVDSGVNYWARIIGNTWPCAMNGTYPFSSVVLIDVDASGSDSFCTYNHNNQHAEGAYYCTSEVKWNHNDQNEAINVCLDSTHLWAEARYDVATNQYRHIMWNGSSATSSTTVTLATGVALRPAFRYTQSGVRGAYVIWDGTNSTIRTNGTSDSPTETVVTGKNLRTGTECSISGAVRGCVLATTGELYIDDGAGSWAAHSAGDVPSAVLAGGTVQYLTGGSDQSASVGPACWDVDGNGSCDPIAFMTNGLARWGDAIADGSGSGGRVGRPITGWGPYR